MMRRKQLSWLILLLLFEHPAWGQENPYIYVKMSLFVPWTLYFIFLACVLIPFVLLILLAWWGHLKKQGEKKLEQL